MCDLTSLLTIIGLVAVIFGSMCLYCWWLERRCAAAMAGPKAALPRTTPSTMGRGYRHPLITLICLCVSLSCSGCNSLGSGPSIANANKVPVSAQINEITKNVKAGQMKAVDLQKLIEDMQSGKEAVASGLPKAHELVVQVVASLESATTALPEASKAAAGESAEVVNLRKENTDLKSSNDQVKGFNLWGGIGLVAAAALIGAGIWFQRPVLCNLGFVVVGISACLFIAARVILSLLHVPDWAWWTGFGVLLVGGGVVFWLTHRKTLAEDAKWMLKPSSPTGAAP